MYMTRLLSASAATLAAHEPAFWQRFCTAVRASAAYTACMSDVGHRSHEIVFQHDGARFAYDLPSLQAADIAMQRGLSVEAEWALTLPPVLKQCPLRLQVSHDCARVLMPLRGHTHSLCHSSHVTLRQSRGALSRAA